MYRGQLGGGYIVGQVNAEGELTGDNIAYIYPDFRTAIRGRWCDGSLVSGHLVSVISSCVTEADIVIPVFSEVINPSQLYRFDNFLAFMQNVVKLCATNLVMILLPT